MPSNRACDRSAYSRLRYGSLQGYADDLLELCRALQLNDVILVGHSVSAMIGVLAANKEPARFQRLVMVGPSPRYLDDPGDGYQGGFSASDIEGLLALLLNLSALERGFAAVYEGADNAVLLCTSTADDDLQTVEAAARAGVDGRSKLGPADRQLVLNRVGELAQMLRTFSMPDEIPGAAPTVTALREEDDERGARDRFLAAIGAGQGEMPANDKLAHRAKSGAAPR